MVWELSPGDVVLRKDLHRKYGGRQQGGISPSRGSMDSWEGEEELMGDWRPPVESGRGRESRVRVGRADRRHSEHIARR